jgi:hypothetical protein
MRSSYPWFGTFLEGFIDTCYARFMSHGSMRQAESETTAVAAGEPAPGESLIEPDQDTESSNEQSASGDGTGSPCAKTPGMPIRQSSRSAVSASFFSLSRLRKNVP